MTGETGGATGTRRRTVPIVVAVFVVALAAGWTALWSVGRSRVADEIDRRLAMLEARGVAVACGDRAIGGYPFRLEVACRDPGVSIAATGARVSAAALRVVAQVWDPRLIIAEFDGPVTARSGDGVEVSGTWRTLRASLRISGTAPERLSVVGEGLDLALAPPGGGGRVTIRAEHAGVHGRAAGATGHDLEVAVDAAALAVKAGDKPIGPPRLDVAATVTAVEALPPGPGDAVRAFAARGGRIEPIRLDGAVGGVAVRGKGALRIRPDGVLDGTIGLAATGLESVVGAGAKLGTETASLLGAFILLGKPSTDVDLPGRRLDLIVDRGRPRFGRVVLPALPPVFGP